MSEKEIQEEIVRSLMELRMEHRDLDDAIIALAKEDYVDQLQLKRLKKRKLSIKDAIQKLESKLIPDVDAWTILVRDPFQRRLHFCFIDRKCNFHTELVLVT